MKLNRSVLDKLNYIDFSLCSYENFVEIVDIENDLKWEEAGERRRKQQKANIRKEN